MRQYIFWVTSLILFVSAATVASLLFVDFKTKAYIFSTGDAAPTTTAALVLGASVYRDGTLSPVLKARADKAAQLYIKGRVSKILVTGDNSSDITHNEVTPVGKYLVARGIPKKDIFLDRAGLDTYSSMYRARNMFGITRMTIVSQPFHLARAVFIARALGADAYGVEAGEGESFAYNTLREVPATIKALFDLNLRREPKYLGPVISIDGDGSETWE